MAGHVDRTHRDPFEVSDPAACIVSLLSRYIRLPLSVSHDEHSIPCMQVSTAAKVQSKRSAIVPIPISMVPVTSRFRKLVVVVVE